MSACLARRPKVPKLATLAPSHSAPCGARPPVGRAHLTPGGSPGAAQCHPPASPGPLRARWTAHPPPLRPGEARRGARQPACRAPSPGAPPGPRLRPRVPGGRGRRAATLPQHSTLRPYQPRGGGRPPGRTPGPAHAMTARSPPRAAGSTPTQSGARQGGTGRGVGWQWRWDRRRRHRHWPPRRRRRHWPPRRRHRHWVSRRRRLHSPRCPDRRRPRRRRRARPVTR